MRYSRDEYGAMAFHAYIYIHIHTVTYIYMHASQSEATIHMHAKRLYGIHALS